MSTQTPSNNVPLGWDTYAQLENWLRLFMTQPFAALWGPDLFPMIEAFLKAFCGPQPAPRPGPEEHVSFTFSVEASIDFRHGRWSVEGPTEWILPRLLQLMGEHGLPNELLAGLRQAGGTLNPPTLVVWLQGSGEGAELGFSMRPPLFFYRLRPLFAGQPGFKRLEAWGQKRATLFARLYGQSISEAPMSEVLVDLPQTSLDAAWSAGEALFEALDVAGLEGEVKQALERTGKVPAVARVWLMEDQTLLAGLRMNDPGTELLLRLADGVGVRELEPVAALEGILNKRGATWLEVHRLVDEPGVVVGYTLDPFLVRG